ncbi:MAG: hypothetical protein IMY80_01935 [Chloroflexi bacterium]|nr:hypothetical protein [Chloroflexota bacterium]
MTVTYYKQELTAPSYTHWGRSKDAETIERELPWHQQRLAEVVAYVDPQRRLLQEIEEAFEECSSENWDGHGSDPVDLITYAAAVAFLLHLPTDIPTAEIAVEPDGEIAFEWYISPEMIFSVSIGPGGVLTYAGRFGAATTHGTEVFEGDIPWEILENLGRLYRS